MILGPIKAGASAKPVLTLGLFQPDARNTDPADRLHRLQMLFTDPMVQRCDLLVCPELFMSGYFAGDGFDDCAEARDGHFAEQVSVLARKSRCAIVYGYPERAGGRVMNSALATGPDGRIMANHQKSLLPHDYEEKHFSAGGKPTIFTLNGWRIGLLICYEVEFPEAVRFYARTGCDLVLAPTACLQQWSVVARNVVPTRAFENNIFVAYANHAGEESGNRYLGESVIVSPWGQDLARAGDVESVITAELHHSEIARARTRLGYLDHASNSCYVS